MGYITNPSDIRIILRTLNSREMQKWTGRPLDDWMLTNEIYDGAPSPYNDGRYAIKMDTLSDADEASVVLDYAGIPFELVDTYQGY